MPALYEKLVKTATLSAVSVALLLIVIKFITFGLTGSVSLLASLLDSSMDILASGLNFFLVRYALKPPDEDHSFGHGKAESLAALAQSLFIIISAIILLFASIKMIVHPNIIREPALGIIISTISVFITGGLVFYQKKVIKKTKSRAVQADMLHYSSDLLMNISVIIAISLTWYGIKSADAIFAFLIACYITYSACKIAFYAVQDLLDKSLPQSDILRIIDIASSYTEVKGLHELKTRQAGPIKFIQLHIELDDHIPLIKAHAVADMIEKHIAHSFSPAQVIIHQDPVSVVAQEKESF